MLGCHAAALRDTGSRGSVLKWTELGRDHIGLRAQSIRFARTFVGTQGRDGERDPYLAFRAAIRAFMLIMACSAPDHFLLAVASLRPSVKQALRETAEYDAAAPYGCFRPGCAQSTAKLSISRDSGTARSTSAKDPPPNVSLVTRSSALACRCPIATLVLLSFPPPLARPCGLPKTLPTSIPASYPQMYRIVGRAILKSVSAARSCFQDMRHTTTFGHEGNPVVRIRTT